MNRFALLRRMSCLTLSRFLTVVIFLHLCQTLEARPFACNSVFSWKDLEKYNAWEKKEVHLLINPTTNEVLMREETSATGGELSPAFLEKMHGLIFSHNHPSGATFSPHDIMTGLAFGATEIRVSTKKRIFSIKFANPPQKLVDNKEQIIPFFYNELSALREAYQNERSRGLKVPTRITQRQIWGAEYQIQFLARRNPWIKYSIVSETP